MIRVEVEDPYRIRVRVIDGPLRNQEWPVISSLEAVTPDEIPALSLDRRAVLRESILLRLLPDRAERNESGWGDLLVRAFFEPLPHKNESIADHIAVFLEDLMAASGGLTEPGTARFALYEATVLGWDL